MPTDMVGHEANLVAYIEKLEWQLQEERTHNARLLAELAAERAKWKPGGPAGSIRDTRPATFGH